MPDRLLLRLPPTGDPTWLRQSADGRVMSRVARGWPPSGVLSGAVEIVVLVPAEDVLLTEARVPARNRAQLLQALPFAVEDQLLAPVESLHFAAATGEGDAVGVAVVAKATLRSWLDRLSEAGIRADAILPDSLALPFAPDHVTLLAEDDRAVARLARWSAFACPLSDLSDWLQRAGDASTRTIDVIDARAASSQPIVPGAARHERASDALSRFASGLRALPLNLLSGEFAPAHRVAKSARWWRLAAALAAAAIVLAVVDLGVDVLQLTRTSARLDTQAQDALRKAFPDIGATDLARMSPADLARSRIERLRGGGERSGFLRLVGEIAPVLGTVTRIQTRGMEFRNGALELGLEAPDVATLDAVRERLAAQPGLKVAVTAANPDANGIEGHIRIDGGGAR
ncbi:MAG TPA: type II secretion system protein GspL [Rhodanobacteraceae bacterium]|jgi:general secretion pathway protein L|nr:type II secretion system protein GspL [Rhodanobacteraceae bacterium]